MEVRDRVEKLLNLARDKGATENERQIARGEAERLIAKHNLDVEEIEYERERKTSRRSRRCGSNGYGYRRVPPEGLGISAFNTMGHYWSNWRPGEAPNDVLCADPLCEFKIRQGTPTWVRVHNNYVQHVHRNGPCGW